MPASAAGCAAPAPAAAPAWRGRLLLDGFISTTSALRFCGLSCLRRLGLRFGFGSSAGLRLRRLLLGAPRPASPSAFAGAAAPFSSTTKIVWPTLTFSPGLILTSLTTPSAEDGTSIVALSVSSSRTAWSFLIASPGLHHHAKNISAFDVLAQLGQLHVCWHICRLSPGLRDSGLRTRQSGS